MELLGCGRSRALGFWSLTEEDDLAARVTCWNARGTWQRLLLAGLRTAWCPERREDLSLEAHACAYAEDSSDAPTASGECVLQRLTLMSTRGKLWTAHWWRTVETGPMGRAVTDLLREAAGR